MTTSRRSFIKSAAALSAAPFILPSKVWSAEVKPNDRIVMGFIGMGKQNKGLLNNFLNQKTTRVVAVCDVDTTRREEAQRRVNEHYTAKPERGSPDCAAYNDF
ncbi:MAG: gfo/Idh/MocA family oxidoreductase, partial [Candidatus Hydrogenedentota bacterium]